MSKPRTSARPSRRAPASLEDLLGFSGNIGSIAGMFLQGVGVMAGPKRKIIDQLGQFATFFAGAAHEKWPNVVLASPGCVMSGCGAEAVLNCMACGKSVCLAHVHVSHRAEGVCDQCVRDVMAMKGSAQQRSGAGRGPSGAEILVALRKLGLKHGATWQDIQQAHRKMAAKHHPDVARTPADKIKREQKCKEINEAFSLLRTVHERDAA